MLSHLNNKEEKDEQKTLVTIINISLKQNKSTKAPRSKRQPSSVYFFKQGHNSMSKDHAIHTVSGNVCTMCHVNICKAF